VDEPSDPAAEGTRLPSVAPGRVCDLEALTATSQPLEDGPVPLRHTETKDLAARSRAARFVFPLLSQGHRRSIPRQRVPAS
jgi:hypothetical protein